MSAILLVLCLISLFIEQCQSQGEFSVDIAISYSYIRVSCGVEAQEYPHPGLLDYNELKHYKEVYCYWLPQIAIIIV